MAITRGTLLFLALLALSGGPARSMAQQPAPANSDLSAVVQANNQFAVDFYRQTASSDKANAFVSPYSVSTALAMTFEGSAASTRSQMAAVLHLNMPDADRKAGFSALLAQTKAGTGKHYKLDVANALWGQKDYHFEPVFTSTIFRYYGGGFFAADYAGDKAGSVKKINTWVEGKTYGKVRNLVHDDDVTELTKLVLTNAIYFKGNWASQFTKEATKQEPFHVSATSTVQAPMMHQNTKFLFAKKDGLAAIEMPYADDELSMIAILPDGDIDKLTASLSLEQITSLRQGMRKAQVDVTFPRFKFETRYILNQELSSMGMPDAFDEGLADFSGMTGNKKLYISKVIHQAMIDVNEEGSEAAAATAVVMSEKAMRIEEKETFRADRPFLFMIVHNATGSILFIGRLSNPSS